jgi:hypothetical protein
MEEKERAVGVEIIIVDVDAVQPLASLAVIT